jgi:hypothetical protein
MDGYHTESQGGQAYRQFPLTSSIEVWDVNTMKHIGSYSIGISPGSLTWLDLHDGSWYPTFANYDRTGQTPSGANTDIPYAQGAPARQMELNARPVYEIRFPDAGSVLEVEETIPANIRGQGIAWDPFQHTQFWGIVRATDEESDQGILNKVVMFQTNVPKRAPKDWVQDVYRFKP